ncbi:hypothetical protein G7046_g5676 [Stylonectria norvegica]|nr:hypothetical protein G7046_g5676 [Stylonectria norvegica]
MGQQDNASAAPQPGEAPPSYFESIRQQPPAILIASSSSSSPPQYLPSGSNAAAQPPPAHPQASSQIPRQFPIAFNLYRQGMAARYYTLGEHQNEPVYIISLHSGFSEESPIVLHSGPTLASGPLATVEWRVFGAGFDVALPPPPGSNRQFAEEKVEWHSKLGGFGVGAYGFSIEAGNSGAREAFEWRHSRGTAISTLGGDYAGWKLVSLARRASSASGGFTDSEGNEVVAAWTINNGSLTKAAKFQFMGSGMTGELGERWAIMAVVTAFAMLQKMMRRRRNR